MGSLFILMLSLEIRRTMSETHIQLLVTPQYDRIRLDTFLSTCSELGARNACAHLIEQGKVEINDTLALSKSERVRMGDRICVAQQVENTLSSHIMPNASIPLDIRYEDDYLLVISKQTGLVCHPSPGHVDDTLSNALVAHCGYEHLGLLQGDDRPGIVHRLDMDTTGLMVAAKDNTTQQALQDLIRLRVFDRRYIVLVQGYVTPDEGTITTGIARSKKNRLKMCISKDPASREAITTFKTLERFEAGSKDDGYSLLECHLYTGRTHQIRVHMRYVGHSVVGDPLYGRKGDALNQGLQRQFLHSWRMSFEHPITHEHLQFCDKLPSDLSEVLARLKPQSMGRTAQGERICTELKL